MLKATPEILEMIADNTYSHTTLVIAPPTSRTHSELWIPDLVQALQTNTHIRELFIYAREVSERCAKVLARLRIGYTFIPKVLPDVLFTSPMSPVMSMAEMRARPATPVTAGRLEILLASMPDAVPMPAPIPIPQRLTVMDSFVPSSPDPEGLRLRADTPHPSPA